MNKKKDCVHRNPSICAEGEGFKPPIPAMGIPDFESSAFGHSANLPFAGAKVILFVDSTKLFER